MTLVDLNPDTNDDGQELKDVNVEKSEPRGGDGPASNPSVS
jgi:hypothetical protein